MKTFSYSRFIVATIVTVILVTILGPGLISRASDLLDQRVADLEARVTSLEATVEALSVGTEGESTELFKLTGELKVAAFPQYKVTQSSSGDTCIIGGDWSVFNGSADVRVRNESGEIIAVGRLYDEFTGDLVLGHDLELTKFSDGCAFYLEVTDLPVSKFYILDVEGIEIATYSFADLESREWNVSITLYSRFD